MQEKMQIVYAHMSLPHCTAQEGDLVAVYHSRDKMWVRGKLLRREIVSLI